LAPQYSQLPPMPFSPVPYPKRAAHPKRATHPVAAFELKHLAATSAALEELADATGEGACKALAAVEPQRRRQQQQQQQRQSRQANGPGGRLGLNKPSLVRPLRKAA
jgi:hypothetical protein